MAATGSVASVGTKTISRLVQKGLPAQTTHALNPYAPVAKWILGTSTLVAGMVHVGGVTRLTKSGLSMTDWKPLGSLPPMTTEEWEVEFSRYKAFPEWQQRKSMQLEDFQFIYYWEWGHRMMGRVVGVCFALPWAYFAVRKRIPAGYHNRMRVLFAMGGTQGLVGWWMVKSGLGENRRGDKSEIRVSPYRLAAHLGMAFTTYSALLWTGFGILQIPNDVSSKGVKSKILAMAESLSKDAIKHAKKVRGGAIAVTSLTALTVVSGAFVAGNDAGNAYNTFPKMDGQWIPIDDMLDPNLDHVYLNAFENTATVQWNHRVLGTSTALSALTLTGLGLFHPASRAAVTPQVSRGIKLLGGVAVGQMSLGIVTLLNYVPIGLAAAHQLGSLVVLSTGMYIVHSLRYVSPGVLRLVGKRIVTQGSTGGATSFASSGVVKAMK